MITKGPEADQEIALDHIIPLSVAPELAARFYNLEAIPSKFNLAKSAKITGREVAIARKWEKAALITMTGLTAVQAAQLQ